MKQSNAYWLSVYQLCFVSYLTFVLSETKETFTSPASAMLSGKETYLIRPCSPNTEIRAARFQSICPVHPRFRSKMADSSRIIGKISVVATLYRNSEASL